MAILGEFGIAHPLYNNRFNVCKRLTSTIYSINSGNKQLFYDYPAYSSRSVNMFKMDGLDEAKRSKAGHFNKIILGPSTNPANLGASESMINFTPLPFSTTVGVVVYESLKYLYQPGDPITIVCVGYPDGWSARTSFNTFGHMSGIIGSSTSLSNANKFGFNFYKPNTGAYTDEDTGYKLSIGKLDINSTYLLRIYYGLFNSHFPNGIKFSIIPTNGGSSLITNLSLPNNTSIDLVEYEATITTGDTTKEYDLVFEFEGGSEAQISGGINSISLTRQDDVQQTKDGMSYYKTSKLYTPTVHPDKDSVQVNRFNDNTKIRQQANGAFLFTNQYKENIISVPRYQVSYHITDMDYEELVNIENLLEHQNRGRLVNHFPNVLGLPYCLTGVLKTSILSGTRFFYSIEDRTDNNIFSSCRCR
jgi:hypothetical protein